MIVAALATIPADGQLPANYERAKQALADTVDIDECKRWADKAAALASYARQAKDDSLQKMAMRIHGRAVQRAGELLREIEPATGKNNQHVQVKRDGTDPLHSRKSAADAAGMSERQRKTAIAVAGIPKDQFDAAVESDDPPTVTRLRALATPPKDTNPIGASAVRELWGDAAVNDPHAFKAATQLAGALADLVTLYEHSPDPSRIVAVMSPHEKAALRRSLMALSPFIADTMQVLS